MTVVEVVMDSTESIYTKSCCSAAKRTMLTIVVALALISAVCAATYVYHSVGQIADDDISHLDVMVKRNTLIQTANGELATGCAYQNVCLTEGCVTAAAAIIEKLNQSIDPCDNFYEFACGKFLQETQIQDEQVAMMSFVAVNDKVQQQLRTIINEPLQDDDLRPITLVKKFNTACLDVGKMTIAPLQLMLEKYGGWPMVVGESWNDTDWKWHETLGKILNDGLGAMPLFRLEVTTDPRASSVRIIDIDQPMFGIDRKFLIQGSDNKLIKAYFNFMLEVAMLFGVPRATAESELAEVLAFETQLANISMADEDRRNLTLLYNRYTVNEMQAAFPYAPWLAMLNGILPAELTVNGDEPITVDVPQYLTKLGTILATTSKRTVSNYFAWRIIYQAAPYLSEELREIKVAYEAITVGRKHQLARWKQCVTTTTSLLSIAVGSMYVRRYFDIDSKRRSIELVNNIREEFFHILRDVSWMDEETRKAALDKAKALENHIGYPDELLDDQKITEFFAKLDITDDSFFTNVLNVRKFERSLEYKLLREPVNKTDWRMHALPSMVNAQYSPLENSIQIPAAILQGAFFSPDRPRYMNYGAIGQIIGHEITHGFDDQGRQFDRDGNLIDWWKEDTQEQFLEKSKCIIEQYGNYTDSRTGMKLNGINTQGENIADNGGLKEAYQAYKRWAENNPAEPYLPGLRYNPQQLFWISAAQTWCSVTRKEYNILLITTDVHSLNEFRVIGTVSNSQDFARDFECPVGSAMNPTKKCEVW